MNLRDFEGRSALLLSKAKDNNASCAVGPFIRVFDDDFTLDDVRQSVVSLHVAGADGFVLEDEGEMRRISRELPDLAAQTCGRFHQYPDGFVLFCGALSAPVQDRGVAGAGFTHRKGDVVRVTSRRIGCLENRVTYCEDAPPWSSGIGALMANLASRRMI
jgi:fumarylacetoacetate (FAA) hydrolase family protein